MLANSHANAAAMKATAQVTRGAAKKPMSFLRKFADKTATHPLRQRLNTKVAAIKARKAKRAARTAMPAKKQSAAAKGAIVKFCLVDADDLEEQEDIVSFCLNDADLEEETNIVGFEDEDLEEMGLAQIKDKVKDLYNAYKNKLDDLEEEGDNIVKF